MKRFIEEYKNKNEAFDVIIIGGGITGSAVAYDAASRGLSVALVEKSDFGSSTSAKTSKLIHGGLRYLVNMEFGLVRESLRERRIMENIAPNFVYPIPNLVLTNKDRITNRKWIIKLGMMLYDILSFDKRFTWDKSKKIPLHKTISPENVMEIEPNVRRKGLTGASMYYDCISIFPERLTLAFIKSAVNYGAKVANYTKVEGFLYDSKNRITGVEVKDLIKDKKYKIKGDLIINCGGPWADIILAMVKEKSADQKIRRSEGIHIITKKLINDHIVTAVSPEGEHFFLIPWRSHSLIGTTDKEYIGSPDNWKVTRKAIQELIDKVNSTFGNKKLLAYKDVQFAYGGLRPLVEDQTKDSYKSSRRYDIYDNSKDGLDGLITVEGGKYTTSRNLAEKVLKLIKKKIDKKLGKMITDKKQLYGSEIKDMEKFISSIKRENSDFQENTLEYLGRNYGTEYTKVLEIARKDNTFAEVLNSDGEILAEVVYAAREEMALTLNDILLRRTGLGTLGNPGNYIIKKAAKTAAKELKWNEARIKEEIEQVKKIFKIPA